MRDSITQESDYGCGVACYAFALSVSYAEAADRLGARQASSSRFWVKDFRKALKDAGLSYSSHHVKSTAKNQAYSEGTIVLIRRSRRYPTGHYLIRHNDYWMDPWTNVSYNKDIARAESGYRKRLPGKVMYKIEPVIA